MSHRLNSSCRDSWAVFLSKRPFTMFVTWKFPKTNPIEDQSQFEHRTIRNHDKYYSFVSKRVFGRKAFVDKSKALRQVTFFERESKFGGYTILHAHSLIEASPENYSRIEYYLNNQWKKFKPYKNSADPYIEKVVGIHRVARYITKFANNDMDFLFN